LSKQAGSLISGMSRIRIILEFGDFGVVELFLLGLKWHLEQKQHLEVFA
jgi:hypothetical protein